MLDGSIRSVVSAATDRSRFVLQGVVRVSEGDSKDGAESAVSAGTGSKLVTFLKTPTGVVLAALVLVALIGGGIALAVRSGDSPNGSPEALESVDGTSTAAGDTSATIDPNSTDASQVAQNSNGTSSGDKVTPPPGGPQNQPLAKQGSVLATLTAPPPQTLGLLKLPEGFESAIYEMTFSPYGWGPGGSASGHLVVKIEKAVGRSGETDEFRDMTGVNASLWTAPGASETIKAGGTYIGTVEVRARGDVGALFLRDVKEKK